MKTGEKEDRLSPKNTYFAFTNTKYLRNFIVDKESRMPKLFPINSLRERLKRSISSDLLKASSVLNIREGEQAVLTYTPATDKMKVFSAFIREGLENGDAVLYSYPEEENETVRAELRKYGIDVGKYEKNATLRMVRLSEYFVSNGKLDYEKAVINGLNWWDAAKKKGYKHLRDIHDVGNFSFVDGQWQKYVTDFWLDPRWDDPDVSEWVESKEQVGVVYKPFIMAVIAINVERMTEKEVTELLKALGKGKLVPARFIDLLENMSLFSRSIGLDHEKLVGRKILLESDPASDYEKLVDDLAKESMADVEPTFVFTSRRSSVHASLAKQPAIKFFLTSVSTSILESVSENEVLLPAKNTSLVLDALSKLLETYVDANVCFVFDILSELLTVSELEKVFIFLRYALDMLSSKKTTGLFLLNGGTLEPAVVSRVRELFSNQLTYNKDGLKIVKIS